MDIQELASKLQKRFSAEELKDLFFRLGINYDDLPGSTRIAKIRELVQFCDRHERLGDLISICNEIRPMESWPKIEQSPSLHFKSRQMDDNLARIIRAKKQIVEDLQTTLLTQSSPEERHTARKNIEIESELLKKHLIDYISRCRRINKEIPEDIGLLAIQKLENYSEPLEQSSSAQSDQDIENFISVCYSISTYTLDILSGASVNSGKVYIPSMYIPMTNIYELLQEFMISDKPCLAIVGEAGIGKTSLLCNTVETYMRELPILFYSASLLEENSIQRQISTDLEYQMGARGGINKILKDLNELLASNKLQLLLIVDAIDDASDLNVLKKTITQLCRRISGSQIKLCISCRDIDWEFFVHNNVSLSSNLHVPSANHNSEYDRDSNKIFLELGEPDEVTHESLLQKYINEYQLKGEFLGKTKEICKQPLMLRLLSEAYSGEPIPVDIRRINVFEKYWKRKISGTGRETEVEGFLFNILSEMREQKTTTLAESRVVELTGHNADTNNLESIFRQMLSEKVVLYRFRASIRSQNIIGFSYSSFFEYVMARFIASELNWHGHRGRIRRKNILKHFEDLLIEMQPFGRYHGVILFLILMMDGLKENIHHVMLFRLAHSDYDWQRVACKVFEGLDIIDETVFEALYLIANQPPWQIRKTLAASLWARRRDYEITISQLRVWYTKGETPVLRTMIWSLPKMYDVLPREVFPLLEGTVRSAKLHRASVLQDTAKVLGEIGSDEAIRLLGELCRDERITVFRDALTALRQINSYNSIVEMTHVFSNSYDDGEFYQTAIDILKMMNRNIVLPALEEISNSQDTRSSNGAKAAINQLN